MGWKFGFVPQRKEITKNRKIWQSVQSVSYTRGKEAQVLTLEVFLEKLEPCHGERLSSAPHIPFSQALPCYQIQGETRNLQVSECCPLCSWECPMQHQQVWMGMAR